MRLALLLIASCLAAVEPGAGTRVVTITGTLPLRESAFPFFPAQVSLHDATLGLRRALAAAERRVVLDLSGGFTPGLAAAEELAAVLRARPPGVHVACLLDRVEDAALVVAAACDEVVMADAGLLAVDGIALDADYYADALALLGVRFHAVTSGPAKTAPEALTRNAPSAAAVRELDELVHGLDAALVALSLRPGLTAPDIAAARARSPQTPAIARETALVHTVAEIGGWLASQSEPIIKHELSAEEAPDLKSLRGMIRSLTTLFQGEGQRPRAARCIAVVELAGTIVDGGRSDPGATIAGADTAALIDRLAGDDRVAALVVRIDSGGGSASASDRIHHALRRAHSEHGKAVVALLDGVAASGGYYIACAADRILVHRGTVTGSIGVFAISPDLSGLRSKLGIHRHTVTTGPRADLWATGPLSEEKERGLRQVVDDVDARFQGLVGAQRHLPAARVQELAGGRVYTGDQAVALGLADGLGTLLSAVALARELAGEAKPLPVERFPRRPGLAALFGLPDGVTAGLLPSPLRALVGLAGGGRPTVLAWSPWNAPR